nr:rhomboid family intramembrane serine protease [Rhodocyclus gracilis]
MPSSSAAPRSSGQIPSLHDLLRARQPRVRVTPALIAVNVLVFLAMLGSGAGLWHSPNGVQLSWGANFGPATQDGEWWRLASAMFLHFGLLHLLLNMWALWDSGQLVERMFGPLRFATIYLLSGVGGNLVSLVSHHGQVVSGGASGAIFGIYGALLVCLWRERASLHPQEFRWLFWGAAGFASITIVLGLIVTGIDNAAHVGGFIAGALAGLVLAQALRADEVPATAPRYTAAALGVFGVALLLSQIPPPAYRWSEEAQARKEISEFIKDDAAIAADWQRIFADSRRPDASFDEVAGRIDASIAQRYEENFEQLSRLSSNPALPSAATLATLRRYAQLRRDASRSLADGLRSKDPRKIDAAWALEQQARALQASPPAMPGQSRGPTSGLSGRE